MRAEGERRKAARRLHSFVWHCQLHVLRQQPSCLAWQRSLGAAWGWGWEHPELPFGCAHTSPHATAPGRRGRLLGAFPSLHCAGFTPSRG